MVDRIAVAPGAYRFKPIGVVRSCFREKFGIPRQPGLVWRGCASAWNSLVAEAEGVLELYPPYDRAEALAGLDAFSHIWLIFVFHGIDQGPRGLTVRPPRLGGNRRLGVLATRSMFRPNPIGLSAVRLKAIERDAQGGRIWLGGVDLLDGTPVLDIKPYVAYADSLPGARAGYAERAPEPLLRVAFAEAAARALHERADAESLRRLIEGVLALDPRPAYRSANAGADARVYAMCLQRVEVRWRVEGDTALVLAIREPAC